MQRQLRAGGGRAVWGLDRPQLQLAILVVVLGRAGGGHLDRRRAFTAGYESRRGAPARDGGHHGALLVDTARRRRAGRGAQLALLHRAPITHRVHPQHRATVGEEREVPRRRRRRAVRAAATRRAEQRSLHPLSTKQLDARISSADLRGRGAGGVLSAAGAPAISARGAPVAHAIPQARRLARSAAPGSVHAVALPAASSPSHREQALRGLVRAAVGAGRHARRGVQRGAAASELPSAQPVGRQRLAGVHRPVEQLHCV